LTNRSSNKSHLPFLFGKRLKQHNAFVFVMGTQVHAPDHAQ
jgi:hypothetical protein